MQKNRHQRTIAQLCWAISSQLRHASTIGKKVLSSNISPTCPYNMVNFGRLAAEIVSLVWGTPANFNGFRVLAALLHGQTAALNRGRHLYSAGRPSRWALAHISSLLTIFTTLTRLTVKPFVCNWSCIFTACIFSQRIWCSRTAETSNLCLNETSMVVQTIFNVCTEGRNQQA